MKISLCRGIMEENIFNYQKEEEPVELESFQGMFAFTQKVNLSHQ